METRLNMWYYVENGQQKGPFDEAQWDGLIQANAITPATLVWKAGQAEWMPLSKVRGEKSGDTCQVCFKPVGADNLIELNGVRVCAACKPVALQSMREGIAVGGGVWADGKQVVTKDNTTFPSRCVKCNARTDGAPLKRKLYWHKPWLYILAVGGILIHVGILIYIIAAVIMRRQATVHMHLCSKHRQIRIAALIVRWGAIPVAFSLFAASVVYHITWLAVMGSLVLLAAIIVGFTFGRITRTARIDEDKTVRLKGAGKEFLASLPPWTGS